MIQCYLAGWAIALMELVLYFLCALLVRSYFKTLDRVTYYWFGFTVLTGFWEFIYVTRYSVIEKSAAELIATKQHVWTNTYPVTTLLPARVAQLFYAEYGAYADREYMTKVTGDYWSRLIESSHALFCALSCLLCLSIVYFSRIVSGVTQRSRVIRDKVSHITAEDDDTRFIRESQRNYQQRRYRRDPFPCDPVPGTRYADNNTNTPSAAITDEHKLPRSALVIAAAGMGCQFMNSLLYMGEYFLQCGDKYSTNYVSRDFPIGPWMSARWFMWVNIAWLIFPVGVLYRLVHCVQSTKLYSHK